MVRLQAWSWCLTLLAATSTSGCVQAALSSPVEAARAGHPVGPEAVDDSMVCRTLADRFIGLPATAQAWPEGGDEALRPSTGRWWVRTCSARARGPDLQVHLEGPGWYWVDATANGMAVKQQVPFQLQLTLTGRLREGATNGVLSLWLEPSAEPVVLVEAPPELEVHTTNAWGDLLRVVPGVSPARRAAQRFNQELTEAFRTQLQAGATLTYELGSGQSDATLGRLAPGKTPRHLFEDEATWLVNDRVVLPPASAQVLGPLDPGSLNVNVIVERGPGLTYRAVCRDTLERNFEAIALGALSRVPASAWLGGGTMMGSGERTATLRVTGCKFYLVLATVEPASTLAAVRIRS